ncbi:protein cereblon-like isoform X2 [Penaeus indicus]|uniref:protein cereblon-like isoform X2 n=1 Tax=Penaeus indicus TaxID=29960 RepID=UPI00300D61BC
MYTNTPLLLVIFFLVSPGLSTSHEDERHDHILCRNCGAELTENTKENFVNVTSPHSESSHWLSVLGHSHLMVQTLRNPADIAFDLVTVKRTGCSGVGEWYSDHSWFPGYSWKVCVCPRCKAHLGWIFEPIENTKPSQYLASSKGFYGLILEKLISEDFSDSLLIGLPKRQRY